MPENNFWNQDWMNLQRRYWEHWTQMQKQALGVEVPATYPWQAAMNHWQEAFKGALPDMSRDFLGKIMDQGNAFLRMADEFTKHIGKPDDGGWKKLVDSLVESFTRTSSAAGDSMNYASGFWEMPLDNWNRMASALSPFPGDMLRGMPTTGVRENLDRILGAPGLGYTRESQEQYQSLFQSVAEYQEALADYSLFFTRMGEGAALRLSGLIGDRPVESARELYDSWIHCCEEEYAEQVMTPEYLRLHGRMVNALMQLKHRWGELLNEYLSAMNVPTQDDLRTLQRRVQEHRREIRQMRSEIAELKKGMATRAAAGSIATSAAPASKQKAPQRKKTAARKKSAVKKS